MPSTRKFTIGLVPAPITVQGVCKRVRLAEDGRQTGANVYLQAPTAANDKVTYAGEALVFDSGCGRSYEKGAILGYLSADGDMSIRQIED